jgi:hypothetical protein
MKKRMPYITCAYYTEKTPYEEEIRHLEKSLDKFNMPRDLVGISSKGNWQANTQYKPYFIKQMLIRHFPKDILYLDADARIQQYPSLFDAVDFDIGVAFREKIELLGGTIYLANNAKVYTLVNHWIEGCFMRPDIWEQRVLQHVLALKKDLHIQVKVLPETYCQIFDLMKECGDPVIEHFQASRRFKS